jgi:hypothetical protein
MSGYPLSLTQQAMNCLKAALEGTYGEEREGLERVIEALLEVDPDADWSWEKDGADIPPHASLGS